MTWKTIRLELASTADFPTGSSSRAYLLRLPLDDDGSIDDDCLARFPARATAWRFWASEPDQFGHVERLDGHYILRCDSQDTFARLSATTAFSPGQLVEIEGPDGARKPFTVASAGASNPRQDS